MSEELDELAEAMRGLTRALEDDRLEPVLFEVICAEAVRAVPDADLASVTVIRSGKGETAATTDPRAEQVDAAQYAAGEGPCLQAAETGEIVRLSLPAADRRWPEFTDVAAELGIGSYLAAPLRVDDELSGALNLFGFGDHGFRELDGQLLKVYVTMVAFGLRTHHRYRDARARAEQLEHAMQTRAVIEQAKGMLMAIHRIGADDAMQRLVVESQTTNTKLRDIAMRFVTTVSDR
ncbi:MULTISPECIES: GAF and ANTAR domain-containing protein [unclassified Amycolatopsis]|uniref:GAF and ANTAR domain-containing protein n=1 Tax=unclassified Amycolatopsis TaxID=2618356 RepID=UPI001C69449C|nr:GAF and ANTAR domain-containing protein [Amycolatopsis sp. DSM 110486]QYN24577.1 GAF and ANTAR domain-containing protein [Amycolatopsis sp. DSM 110486]